MKIQNSTRTKTPRHLSDAIIEKRYLDLQQLREAVRKAEMNCAMPNLKKAEDLSAASNLLARQRPECSS